MRGLADADAVNRFADKRKCSVGESIFLGLREQTP